MEDHPMEKLRVKNKMRELSKSGRKTSIDQWGKNQIHFKSILKSSGSCILRGGSAGRNKRRKRAVSFSNNLERIHFFDPTEKFKPARKVGNSADFRITISNKRRDNVGSN